MDKFAISQPNFDQTQSRVNKRVPPSAEAAGGASAVHERGAGGAHKSAGPAARAPGHDPDSKIKDLQRLADEAFEKENLRLSISFDKEAGRFVYRGVDRETGEVVRQYPPEEIIDQIAAIREFAGVIVDRKL